MILRNVVVTEDCIGIETCTQIKIFDYSRRQQAATLKCELQALTRMHVRLITQSQTHASRTRIREEAHTLSHSNGLTSTHGLKLCHMLCQLCQVPACEGTRASQSDWTGEGMVMGKEAHTVLVVPHAAWESNPGLRGRTEHPFGYIACCKQHTRRGRRVWGCERGFRGIRHPSQRVLFLNMGANLWWRTAGLLHLLSHPLHGFQPTPRPGGGMFQNTSSTHFQSRKIEHGLGSSHRKWV